MSTERIVIVGGSSGMGLALAAALVADGAQVTIAGRSVQRLATAQQELAAGDRLRAVTADITREADIERLFTEVGPVNHVVATAADATDAYQQIGSFDLDKARNMVDTKLYGSILLAKHAEIMAGGSLTYVSGVAAYRPMVGGSIVAAVNGAIESLVYALALELGPIRVNAVSPGWVDTPIWDTVAGKAKTERLAGMAQRLPLGRVGSPQDVAQAVRSVMDNRYITGTVLHVDGGHRLV